jgi:hypothetical protein
MLQRWNDDFSAISTDSLKFDSFDIFIGAMRKLFSFLTFLQSGSKHKNLTLILFLFHHPQSLTASRNTKKILRKISQTNFLLFSFRRRLRRFFRQFSIFHSSRAPHKDFLQTLLGVRTTLRLFHSFFLCFFSFGKQNEAELRVYCLSRLRLLRLFSEGPGT